MDRFIDALKQRTASQDATIGRARVGTVQSVNPADHTARVLFQPEGALSGWLPALAWRSGVGAPPVQGDQVLVEAQEGDAEHGVIVGLLYSDAARPPQVNGAPAQPGEFLYVNPASGAAFYVANSGHITLKDPSGATVEMLNSGTVKVTGTLLVTGDIIDQNGTHGSVAALRTAYNAHAHADPQGGTTGTTDHPV